MLRIVVFVALALLLLMPFGGRPITADAPREIEPDTLPTPLRTLVDNDLQLALDAMIAQNGQWSSLTRQGKMAVSLVDMRNEQRPRFAQTNGDQMMYAASLPKIAILLAAMDALEKGELEETPEVKRDMRLMIARSDNHASTRMIDRLGFEKIEAVLTDPQYSLYDDEQGGGLWVGKRYASAGRRYPDPMQGLSHAATSTQVCRFYYLLAEEALVSPERSRQMMNILANPELHHKFVNSLERIAPRATLFRKSGSWRTYHSDSVMVLGPERHYILVALVDDAEGEVICRELASSVDDLLKAFPVAP